MPTLDSATVYRCPVDDCGWVHVEPPIDPRISGATLAGVFGPNIMLAHAQNSRAEKIERVLQDHLRTHTVAEWVATVTRLQAELKEARDAE